MKVLVTGASGFVGSHLVPELINKGYDVYALERYVTGRYAEKKKYQTVFADLREHYAIRHILRSIQPEIIIHLASISPVSYSYNHYDEVMQTNFLATINLAETCLRELPHFKQFLFAGTSEEYGNNGFEVQYETNPLCPASPYGVSKVACEKYLNYMREAYEFPITILRPFNTYGRKNDTHFFIERAIFQMLTEKMVRLIDPKPIRDWLYISDHVKAYLMCIENEKAIGETFNFCTGQGFTTKQTAEKISQIVGFDGEIQWETSPSRPVESKIIVGSFSKAEEILGWKPEYSLEKGLEETVEYWKHKA